MTIRLLLLADINSVHTQKWAVGLANKGFEIGIFSLNRTESNWFNEHENISCVYMPDEKLNTNSFFTKINYLSFLPRLLSKIKSFKPDVVHAHYASSYGLLGALSNFHPFVISAWGTDIMRFPQKNFLCKEIIKYSLNRADVVCATSETLKSYISELSDKRVEVIPFGVDFNKFYKQARSKNQNTFTIGCVKALEKIYNINSLLIAFSYLKEKYRDKNLKLEIIGSGSEEVNLKAKVYELNLSQSVVFKGKVEHSQMADCINKFDVLVNLSEYESFGVCVVEAMACEVPVIVSNAEGLVEVVNNKSCGNMVEAHNIGQIVFALEKYLCCESLGRAIAGNALDRVKNLYNWENNLQQMVHVYQDVLGSEHVLEPILV